MAFARRLDVLENKTIYLVDIGSWRLQFHGAIAEVVCQKHAVRQHEVRRKTGTVFLPTKVKNMG